MCQDIKNVHPVFDPLEKQEGKIPPGYQEINCHFIFNIKMGENFFQKACFVAGCLMTESPATLTCVCIVSRDFVRIVYTIKDLNGLDILLCDIQNAYLTAEFQ